jgi:hypothetical protein
MGLAGGHGGAFTRRAFGRGNGGRGILPLLPNGSAPVRPPAAPAATAVSRSRTFTAAVAPPLIAPAMVAAPVVTAGAALRPALALVVVAGSLGRGGDPPGGILIFI